MKKSLVFIFAAAAMLAGCAKPELAPSEPAINVPEGGFIASFADPVATKTVFAEGSYNVLWEEGDIITFNEGWAQYKAIDVFENGSKAIFVPEEGSLFAEPTVSGYIAHYGPSALTEQVYNSGRITNLPMVGQSINEYELQFSNECAVLEINCYSGLADQLDVYYGNDHENPVATVKNAAGATQLYIAVPPTNNAKLYIDNGTMTMETYGEVMLEANTIYPISFGEITRITTSKTTHTLTDADKDVYFVVGSGNYTDKTITITDNGTKSRAIYVDLGGKTIRDLIINAPKAHVEVFNGIITSAAASTSASTFVVKKGATVTNLTVNGGNVAVQSSASVGTITIPSTNETPVVITMEEGANITTVTAQEGASATVVVPNASTKPTNTDGAVTTTTPVATVGTTAFGSLADAVAVAATQKGSTVTLLQDASGCGIIVPSGSEFKLDFGGHTYTVKDAPLAGSTGTKNQCFQLLKDSKLTFKNGKIVADNSGIKMMIQNYSSLTLTDMTVDATEGNNNVNYVVSNNCGNVVFDGNTTIKSKPEGHAFDVCKYGSYSEPTVTWNSTGSVVGNIELTGGELVVAKDLALTYPIVASDASAKLTVNAKVTPAASFSAYANTKDALVLVKRTGDLTIAGTGSIDCNNTESIYAAVKLTTKGETGDAAAKLTVNSGSLKGYYYAVVGNGERHNTEITINGGKFSSVDGLAIYHPQDGKLTVNGGEFEGTEAAIELRAGTLEIAGGKFTSTATEFKCNANGNGSTTIGAAIAISQHTTKKNISVNITGGEFNGIKALNESNPQANDPQPQVDLTVSGGTFNGEISATDALKFITGGTFSADPSAYLDDDYTANESNGVWTVVKK